MTKFKELKNAVRKFGINIEAKTSKYKKEVFKNIFKENDSFQLENIIDILPHDNNSEILIVTEDGKILRTTLHIAFSKSNSNNKEDLDMLHKYHIYKCGTINNRNNNGSWYLSIRDRGKFIYNFIDKSYENQELNICTNCLKIFENENQGLFFKEFNLKEFLSSEPFSEIDENIENEYFHIFGDGLFDLSHIDFDFYTLPLEKQNKINKYVKEWHRISLEYRKIKNYTCEVCKWKPKTSQGRRFIHTHHINKNTQENEDKNLKALCIECHSKEPKHLHVKNLKDYKTFKKGSNYF
jgi:hypothetical protein